MDRYVLASYLVAVIGMGIMFLSTILPDTDRNGIAGCCVIGGVILGGSPLIAAYRSIKALNNQVTKEKAKRQEFLARVEELHKTPDEALRLEVNNLWLSLKEQ